MGIEADKNDEDIAKVPSIHDESGNAATLSPSISGAIGGTHEQTAVPPNSTMTPPTGLPHSLLSSGKNYSFESQPDSNNTAGQDENLKTLMMSWYYAGYYTGFHEGQQKAVADLGACQSGE